jgi:hypothetical protein
VQVTPHTYCRPGAARKMFALGAVIEGLS